MTVEDSTANLVQGIYGMPKRLSQLWDQIHMDTELRERRVQQAYEIVHNLLDEIVSSEEQVWFQIQVEQRFPILCWFSDGSQCGHWSGSAS